MSLLLSSAKKGTDSCFAPLQGLRKGNSTRLNLLREPLYFTFMKATPLGVNKEHPDLHCIRQNEFEYIIFQKRILTDFLDANGIISGAFNTKQRIIIMTISFDQ